MTRTLRRVPWWAWVGIGWAVVGIPVGVAVGRAVRIADRHQETTRPIRAVPPPPRTMTRPVGGIDSSLAGAILALSTSTDETTARYWLAVCAQRGADWDLQRQLWDGWLTEHDRHVTYLYTDPEDPTP